MKVNNLKQNPKANQTENKKVLKNLQTNKSSW